MADEKKDEQGKEAPTVIATVKLDLKTGSLSFKVNTAAAPWMLYGMLEQAKDIVRAHEQKRQVESKLADLRKGPLIIDPNHPHPALRKH